MKINILHLLFVSVILSSSCKKVNQEDLISDSFEATKVYAGVSDTSLFNYTFINPISIELTFDSSNLYGNGSTHIDFDLNGINDLTVYMNLVNQDSLHLLNGNSPNPSPSCSIETSSSLSIAMLTEEISLGGATYSHYWCDTLEAGVEIGADLYWSNVNSELDLWSQLNGTSIGTWYLLNEISYIGFRFNDKYGWIEVNAVDPYNLIFTKFAMQR